MVCAHEEFIDEDGLGVCKKCGQVKQYNKLDPNLPPVLITKGNCSTYEPPLAPGEKKRAPLTKEQIAKILVLFDKGLTQKEIKETLEAQDNIRVRYSSLASVLNQRRPNRIKKPHGVKQPIGQPSEKTAPTEQVAMALKMGKFMAKQEFTPAAYWRDLELSILKAVVKGDKPEQLRTMMIELKKQMTEAIADLEKQIFLMDSIVDYFAPDTSWQYGYSTKAVRK